MLKYQLWFLPKYPYNISMINALYTFIAVLYLIFRSNIARTLNILRFVTNLYEKVYKLLISIK